jgi:hypothetical protein
MEYLRLRAVFLEEWKGPVKSRRPSSFAQDLYTVLGFIERSQLGDEDRSILAGIAFAGPYICVNVCHLKTFIGRCKSSINSGFQTLGYSSLKVKVNEYLTAVLPSLHQDAGTLRQWTVRAASADVRFCFLGRRRAPKFGDEESHASETVPALPPSEPPVPAPKRVAAEATGCREFEIPGITDMSWQFGELWLDRNGEPEDANREWDTGFAALVSMPPPGGSGHCRPL